MDHAEQAAPARISVLGAVMRPRTYEFSRSAPDVGTLLERAGGLTGNANRVVRVIRNGQQVGAVRYAPGMRLPLTAGDVVLCDPAPHTGPRERGRVYLALVGLTDRPVLLKLGEADANVPSLLTSLDLPPQSMAAIGVLPPAGTAAPAPGGPLPDGTVLVFGAGSVTPAQFAAFADQRFGDLVPEEDQDAVSLADSFEPVKPRSPRSATPASSPAPPAEAAPAFRISPRRSTTPSRDWRLVTPPLTLPAAPDGGQFTPADSLPTPSGSRTGSPRESAAGSPYALAAPAAGTPVVSGHGTGETVVDVTNLYDSGPTEVAMLPAPEDSPYYGGGAEGLALADSGSHLVPLENYGELPGGLPPSPGNALPGGLAAPGGFGPDPMRVATSPLRPGRYSDATPGAPRSLAGPSGAGPYSAGRSSADAPQLLAAPPTAPQPIPQTSAKPIPSEAVTPAASGTTTDGATADDATANEAAAGGFPWLPVGLGFGALLGGLAAAFVALRRKHDSADEAVPATAATAAPAAPAPVAAGPVAAAPVAAAPVKAGPVAAASVADDAVKAAPAVSRASVLEDLIADRLPMEEEAIQLPESVALYGRSAGMTKLRVQTAEGGPAAPRFAHAEDRVESGAELGAGSGAGRRTESFAV